MVSYDYNWSQVITMTIVVPSTFLYIFLYFFVSDNKMRRLVDDQIGLILGLTLNHIQWISHVGFPALWEGWGFSRQNSWRALKVDLL